VDRAQWCRQVEGAVSTLGADNFSGPSPDGQKLYVRRLIASAGNDAATGSTSVLVIPVSGGQPRELMHTAMQAASGGSPPNAASLAVFWWAPDSRSLWVKKPAGSSAPPEIGWVPVDGGEPRRVDTGLLGDVSFIRAHPDGQQVAIVGVGRQTFKPYGVWVLEHFLPKAAAQGGTGIKK
jgi:hypothetical protein